MIADIGRDPRLEGALLVQTDRPGLIALYNQFMPNHSGSLFNIVAASAGIVRPADLRSSGPGGWRLPGCRKPTSS